MKYVRQFETLLEELAQAQQKLEGALPLPKPTMIGSFQCWRYETTDIHHALVIKLARIQSACRAALILWKHGHFQEQAMLERVLDEAHEDVLFLVYAVANDDITDLHKRFLDSFWQEDDDGEPGSKFKPKKREMVKRVKIQAYLSRIAGNPITPHEQLEASKALFRTYSGFVHGAAPHIMDMYSPTHQGFAVSGMLGTPRVSEYEDDLWNYMYRSLISYVFVFKAFGAQDQVAQLVAFKRRFEAACGKDYGP